MLYHFESQTFVTREQLKAYFPNCSIPEIITKEVADFFDVVPVLPFPKPEINENQFLHLQGVKQDRLGNWVEDWVVLDKENLSIF
jgi:hypothetical protein